MKDDYESSCQDGGEGCLLMVVLRAVVKVVNRVVMLIV